MLPFYLSLVDQFKWETNQKLVDGLKASNDETIKQLDDKVKDAEENLGETEIREAYLARADFYCRIGDRVIIYYKTTYFYYLQFTTQYLILKQEKAVTAYRQTFDKTVALGQKLDVIFALIRLGLFWKDDSLITRNIEKAKRYICNNFGWEGGLDGLLNGTNIYLFLKLGG